MAAKDEAARDEADDLDILRAARLESLEARPPVVLFGEEWHLVAELPFAFGERFARSRLTALALLFADPGPTGPEDMSTAADRTQRVADRFLSHRPADADFGLLLTRFGVSLGKSSAS